jgi:hypothetical protein
VSGRDLKIDFARSGGLGGMIVKTSIDADELPDSEAEELERLVDEVDLEGVAGASPAPVPGQADRYQYDLVVERGGQQHEITLPEEGLPAPMRPLVDKLVERAEGGSPY